LKRRDAFIEKPDLMLDPLVPISQRLDIGIHDEAEQANAGGEVNAEDAQD
jgi:hypothetical protein